jgi:hypothetical protein
MSDLVARLTNTCNILVGKPEGKRPLGRQRRGWENNIKIYFKENVWQDVEWIQLAQDMDQWRDLVDIALKLRVPRTAKNLLTR